MEIDVLEKKGWKNVDELITLSREAKETARGEKQIKTPGKYVKVYELYGTLPDWWMDDKEDNDKYTKQLHVVAFYETGDDEKNGIVLYKGKAEDDNVEIKTGGTIPELSDEAVPHWDLCKTYDIIDFELGNKITGAGFPVYKGKG